MVPITGSGLMITQSEFFGASQMRELRNREKLKAMEPGKFRAKIRPSGQLEYYWGGRVKDGKNHLKEARIIANRQMCAAPLPLKLAWNEPEKLNCLEVSPACAQVSPNCRPHRFQVEMERGQGAFETLAGFLPVCWSH